jgi:hypothetical protein
MTVQTFAQFQKACSNHKQNRTGKCYCDANSRFPLTCNLENCPLYDGGAA